MSAVKKMTNNYLIAVTNLDILKLNKSNISFLFPITNLSVGFLKTFEIKDITYPNSYLYVNRILDKESINYLDNLLNNLPKNIKGIAFTDLGVLEVLKKHQSNLKTFYMQNHNTTNSLSVNYYLDYVDSLLISTDITGKEIINILDKAKKPLILPYFTLIDAMYSRRLLLTNYTEHYNLPKRKEAILQEKVSKVEFNTIENEYGTVLYNKKYLDYRSIKHQNILYNYINPLYLDLDTIKKILNNEEVNIASDTGFLNNATIYKVKEGLSCPK